MRTLVAIAHQIDTRCPDREVRWKPCPFSKELWEFLMEYDGGSKGGALHFHLRRYKSALAFVTHMQKASPGYCLCDLGCWLCLAKPS